MEIIVAGNIGNGKTQSRTVYDTDGISPTLCSGMDHGNTIPYIIEIKGVDKVNDNATIAQSRAEQSRAEQSRAEQRLGNIYGAEGGSYAGQVYDVDALCPTLTNMQGGGRQPHIVETQRIICAMRGRNTENPSDRTAGIELEQRLEPQSDGICNTLTSVQKDNLVLEIKKTIDQKYHDFIYDFDGVYYLIRIRKLTPRECWRLMAFMDEDFDKAQQKVSNTQLYKQAGNSIVVACLEGIFRQMIDGGD